MSQVIPLPDLGEGWQRIISRSPDIPPHILIQSPEARIDILDVYEVKDWNRRIKVTKF